MTPTISPYAPYIVCALLLAITWGFKPALRWITKPKDKIYSVVEEIASILHEIHEATVSLLTSASDTGYWTTLESRLSTRVQAYYVDYQEKAAKRHIELSNRLNQGLGAMEALNQRLLRDHTANIAALDAIALNLQQLNDSQRAFVKSLFSGDASGYTDMTDDQAQLREQADKLQRRYGIPWDEAMERAKQAMVYKPNGGMGANA